MNKVKTIFKLLFSKEYYLITVEREGNIIVENVYSYMRKTETTYKKLIKALKEELKETRKDKYE